MCDPVAKSNVLAQVRENNLHFWVMLAGLIESLADNLQ